MKKVILLAALAMMTAVGANAQNRSWRKTDDHAARKNSVTVFGSAQGWHKITGYQMGHPNPAPAPALDTCVKPHLMVDACWVLRATRWLDLRFSPLLLSPSQFIVGGKFNAPYNNSTFRYFNMGTLGATVRF